MPGQDRDYTDGTQSAREEMLPEARQAHDENFLIPTPVYNIPDPRSDPAVIANRMRKQQPIGAPGISHSQRCGDEGLRIYATYVKDELVNQGLSGDQIVAIRDRFQKCRTTQDLSNLSDQVGLKRNILKTLQEDRYVFHGIKDSKPKSQGFWSSILRFPKNCDERNDQDQQQKKRGFFKRILGFLR